ncbi:hypothetical protein Y032_0124g1205 [Ancylostoma ceylanicum]|uniref:Malic enzyme n=1 Tax=Ancylostoma ceylanicum TaxID=53326 RepID=A0A016T924_9BILA|nr:hypothetical protein Y032_0124g1205 [Ancylostoma ceylanicum]
MKTGQYGMYILNEKNAQPSRGRKRYKLPLSWTVISFLINFHDFLISRRRKAGWLKFKEEKDILLSKIDPKRKAEIYNTTVLPAMICGCEIWAPTKVEEGKLETTVRAMKRAMSRNSLRDRITNEEIRKRTGVKDIIQEIRKSRIKWAGHVARMNDGRWTAKVLNWYPRDKRRSQGRPRKRWQDFIKDTCSLTWIQRAKNREEWNKINFRGIAKTTWVCQKANGQVYDLSNPQVLALHKLYRKEQIHPHQRGFELLKNPHLNKGLAFSLRERHYLGLHGLLPASFMSIDQQVYRTMVRIREQPDNLSKYILLDELQNRAEKLFYRVLIENVKELMPIVYTPTVGLACQKFGAIFRCPKGLYITINDNSISKIYRILSNWPQEQVKAIVVTDGERILGLGDLGACGMGIPVGKLALYVALAGIRPSWCLPVVIDVGTNNEKHLEDPLYIGLRRKRVRGEEYERLIDNFMKAVAKMYGRGTLVQFEDFAFENAYKFLDRYKDQYCVFNDDIQGTASVIVAGLIATTRVTKKKLCEQKFVFHGAGAAGLGIAELMVTHMIDEGATAEQACNCIYMNDIGGLVTKKRAEKMTERHRRFAKDMPETKSLFEIVKTVKPNGIIGVSTQGGAFTPEIIKEMATLNERPIIFALSNPTQKAECTAKDAIEHTNGKVLFASGSPFDNVDFNGKLFKPGQGNNSYIFPGVGLAVVIWQAKKVPDRVFLIAARTCARMVPDKALNQYGRLYPRLKNIRELSVQIAIDVGEYLYKEHLAMLWPKPENMEMYVRHQIYEAEYDELISKAYRWPEQDSKQGFPVPKLPRSSMDDE